MEIGFKFKAKFKRNLSNLERHKLSDDFIDFIEDRQMYWGGGDNAKGLQGYLDCSSSKLELSELVKQVFDYFSELPIVSTITIKIWNKNYFSKKEKML